jgi:RimJ/RimL family protein N-acetyltransferase
MTALLPPMLHDRELCLRPWRRDDAPALVDLLHASMDSIGRWMSWCTPSYALTDALRWLAEVDQGWASGEGECALAITTGAGPPLGCIGVNQFRREHLTANIGYWIGEPHQGHGLAARAVRLLAPFAFAHLGLRRLEIVVAEHNLPSRRTAEKAAARFEGIARRRLVIGGNSVDAAMYALVAEDFATSGPAP